MDGELNFLRNEINSNTQSTNARGIVVSNDPQLSLSRYLSDLFDEFAFISVEEVVEHNVGGELLGKRGREGEVPSKYDALTSRKMLDENLTGGEGLEFGSELLHGERNKSFSLRRVAC